MGESIPNTVKLPRIQFEIGEEPKKEMRINHFVMTEYIQIVKGILGTTQFERVKLSFLGPALRVAGRSLTLSAKIVHCVLCRSLHTLKKNELWFHFGAQPMRFSIREFHMVTGLKCSKWEPIVGKVYKQCDWAETDNAHTVEDVVQILKNTDTDSVDERFCLGMLILIESMFLNLYNGTKFPAHYLKNAQDIELMMNYPWGLEAYKLLIKSIKRSVSGKHNAGSNLLKPKYDLQGYSLGFLVWILESVPQLQKQYSRLSFIERPNAYLCEKYTHIGNPSIAEVENIEGYDQLKVICILPSIQDDPEDEVAMEDEDDPDIDLLVDVVNKGYRLTAEDWRKGSLDLLAILEDLAANSFKFCQKETVIPSTSWKTMIENMDRLKRVIEDGFNTTNERLSKLEEEVRKIADGRGDKEREFETQETMDRHEDTINVTRPTTQRDCTPPVDRHEHTTPVDGNQDKSPVDPFERDSTQDASPVHEGFECPNTQPISQYSEAPTTQRMTEECETHFETCGSKSPTPTQPITQDTEELFELALLDEVEVFYKNHLRRGHVRAILTDFISIEIDDLMKVQDYKREEVRFVGRAPSKHEPTIKKGTAQDEQTEKNKDETQEITQKNSSPVKKNKRLRMEVEREGLKKKPRVDLKQEVQRRSKRLLTPSVPTVTPYKAARNHSTAAIRPTFNPFLSPSFSNMEEFSSWKSSNIKPGVITDTQPLTPHWFNMLEKPETHLQNSHIDAALGVIWLRRKKDPLYFHNKRLPKSVFVGTGFINRLIECYENFKKDAFKSQFNFPKELLDVVRGTSPSICFPVERWVDNDGVYGVAYCSKQCQYIGMDISFKSKTITVIDCRGENSKGDLVQSHVIPFATMIPYLIFRASGKGKDDEALSAYRVSVPKKFVPRGVLDANCGLFVVKMIECHSLGIEEEMKKLEDNFADDTRNKVAYDIYSEFVVNEIDLISV